MKQGKHEEVSAFASWLDNQLRKAKEKGTELLPDDAALDQHLRLLFWEGPKPSIKDKARHKKEKCKTFGELISAARYGERGQFVAYPYTSRQVLAGDSSGGENTQLGEWILCCHGPGGSVYPCI